DDDWSAATDTLEAHASATDEESARSPADLLPPWPLRTLGPFGVQSAGITLSGILDAALQTPFRHSRGCAAPPRRQIFPSRLRRSSHSEEPRPMRPDRNNFPTGGNLCHGHVWPASLPRPIGAIGKAANRDAIFRPGLCQSRQHSVNFVAGEAG